MLDLRNPFLGDCKHIHCACRYLATAYPMKETFDAANAFAKIQISKTYLKSVKR